MKLRMTPDTEESIRCTVSGCGCVCFKPGSVQLRSCDRCGHGWVAHALGKLQLQVQPPSSCGPVEVALPGLVFDLSSLVLYGAQAVPVRLKILLDRLYSVLSPQQVGHIIHTLGWSLADYVRGYVLQFPGGRVLDRWLMVTPEEELIVLKQFLRFGETRPIVELMTLQRLATSNHVSPLSPDPQPNPAPKSCQSNIRTFIERNGGTPAGTLGLFRSTRGDLRGLFEKTSPPDHSGTAHHFENFPGGLSLLLPFHLPSSTFHFLDLAPPTKDLAPPPKPMRRPQKPGGAKPSERHRQEVGGRERESDVVFRPAAGDLGLKIKPDPDAPRPARSPWQQNHHQHHFHRIHDTRDPDPKRGRAKEETGSPLTPVHLLPSSLHSSLLPSSSSSSLPQPFSSSSSSPPKASQELQVSSSSLLPLPSSLCSLSSSSGGRKGRVCCGVCGKSFYDKGTLKIHYNAVHLKIKHRCTVAGCSMVFSSLRSRNRHSANPNPRLHTGSRDTHTHRNTHTDTQVHSHANGDTDTQTNRERETQAHIGTHTNTHATTHRNLQLHTHTHSDTHTHTVVSGRDVQREPEVADTRMQQDGDVTHTHRRSAQTQSVGARAHCQHVHAPRNEVNAHMQPQHGRQPDAHPSPSLQPLPQSLSPNVNPDPNLCDSAHRSSLPLQAPPPSPRITAVPLSGPSPVTLETCDGQPMSSSPCGCSAAVGGACISLLAYQNGRWGSCDPVPKKKPRKSSTPVKIEREEKTRVNNMLIHE